MKNIGKGVWVSARDTILMLIWEWLEEDRFRSFYLPVWLLRWVEAWRDCSRCDL